MSYETDLKKFQKMYEAGQANQINLDFTDVEFSTNAQILSDISQRANINTNTTDVGDTTFQPVTALATIPAVGNSQNGSIVYGRSVDVKIKNVPAAYLPFVRFNIGVDKPDAVSGTISWFVQTEAQNSQNTVFTATWHVSYSVQTSTSTDNPQGTQPDFNIKVYLTILNPTNLL